LIRQFLQLQSFTATFTLLESALSRSCWLLECQNFLQHRSLFESPHPHNYFDGPTKLFYVHLILVQLAYARNRTHRL